MTLKKSGIILCPHCSQEAPVKTKKIYQGLKYIGNQYTCGFCQYEFSENEIPWAEEKTLNVIDTTDTGHICQYCKHYIINPFTQRCLIHQKDVNATDSCAQFIKKEPKSKPIEQRKAPPFLR